MKITKPLEFFGAYVSDVSVGMGWGSESGFCNLDLVEESKDGKIFTPPALGTGCVFTIGKLKFGGVFKRYTYSEDVGSGRKYQVVLESPNSLLSGIQIILNKFQGTFYNSDLNVANPSYNSVMTYGQGYPTNVFNLFADKENYEYGGFFGGAGNNSLGYPVANFLYDINYAIGRGLFAGKVKFANTEYDLDLSELAQVIAYIPQYRINKDFTDLGSLISDICDTAAYDYTVTLTGKTNSLGVITSNAKIKVKVLSRQSPPNPNIITGIINEYKNKPDADKTLISYNIGKEYADIVTQKVLIGGRASRYWLANRNHILPIWGSLGSGDSAQYFYGNSLYEYKNMFTRIRVTIDGGDSNNFTYVDTNLLELRCALGGRECWTAYHILLALKERRKGITIGNFAIQEKDFVKLLKGQLGSQDIMDTGIENAIIYGSWLFGRDAPLKIQQTYAQKVIDTRFNSLVSAAQNFYGKQFLVAIPGEVGGIENSIRWVENFKYENAWDTADSAWAGDYNFFDFPDINFYDDNGRFKSVVVYPNYNNADYSSLGSSYSRTQLGTNYGVFTECKIDREWGIKWFNNSTIYQINQDGGINRDSAGNAISASSTVGYVKVNIDNPIDIYDEYTSMHNGFNTLCGLIFGTKIQVGYHNLFGFGNFDFAMPPSRMAPEFIGIPQESNRYVWGPWFSFNKNSGQAGKAEITEDTSISPETFGSTIQMNQYAYYGLNAEFATILESETGTIELAEAPNFDLAERFFGSGPYVTSMSVTASVGGGYKTTYQFSTWTKNFGSLSKYNIDLFKKYKSDIFANNKKIRELFKNPVPKAINTKLLSLIEKKLKKENLRSGNMIAGTMFNSMMRSLNGTPISGTSPTGTPASYAAMPRNNLPVSEDDGELGIGVASVGADEAMRGLGLNYMENFAAGYEQIFSPVFAYDQTDPARVKRRFNEGNI